MPPFVVAGKLFLITGSSRGLGRAFAEAVLKEGGLVTLSSRNADDGERTATELRERFGDSSVHYVPCDVTVREDFSRMWEESELFFRAPVDVLVNNAGALDRHDHQRMIEVNLLSLMTNTKEAFHRFGIKHSDRAGGLIINIADMTGLQFNENMEEILDYSVAKHGVVAFTKGLGNDKVYREQGIRVNALCPGFVSHFSSKPSWLRKIARDNGVSESRYIPTEQITRAFLELVKTDQTGVISCVTNGKASTTIHYNAEHGYLQFLKVGSRLAERLGFEGPFDARQQKMFLVAAVLVIHWMLNFFWSYICG